MSSLCSVASVGLLPTVWLPRVVLALLSATFLAWSQAQQFVFGPNTVAESFVPVFLPLIPSVFS